MKLELAEKYLSLAPFLPIDLPSYTVLTGLNGSGKSQLLAAIKAGAAKTDLLPKHPGHGGDRADRDMVQLFKAHQFLVDAKPNTNQSQFNDVSDRDQTTQLALDLFQSEREEVVKWGEKEGWTEQQLRAETVAAWSRIAGVLKQNPQTTIVSIFHSEFDKLLFDLEQRRPKLPSSDSRKHRYDAAITISSGLGLPVFALTLGDWIAHNTNVVPLFPVSVSLVCSIYRDRFFHNSMKALNAGSAPNTSPALSQTEFEAIYGPAPWVTINEVLQRLGLDVELEPPALFSLAPYHPQIRSSDGSVFDVGALSSGEQVLLNLALCGYQADSKVRDFRPPKLILLDEVDAPLHPAMIQTFHDIVLAVLVEKFGMKVIATTHSPSSVALSPPSSVYLMKRGAGAPLKIDRDEAIGQLTSGVPTLSVSLENRRQIFTESPIEADNLELLYRLLKPRLSSPLSLTFIATGTKERGSGCANVIRIVGELAHAGNKTAFGLIDWDEKNVSTDRIVVIGESRRYTLENVILDPLLLSLFILRFYPDSHGRTGLDKTLRYSDLVGLDPSVAQRAVTDLGNTLFGGSTNATFTAEYCGGLTLQISSEFAHMKGHLLEELVARKLPMLESLKNAGSGTMTKRITRDILEEHPDAVPIEVLRAFEQLLAK